MENTEIKSIKKIAAKLVAVMEECSHVLKRGINDFHKYSYATSADVLEMVNAALVKQGICSVVSADIINLENVVNSRGNNEQRVSVKVNIDLIDSSSGETLTITGIGNGQDAGDKAVMKAETAAMKYAYMMSLAISTGDDPEADTKTDENNSYGYSGFSAPQFKSNVDSQSVSARGATCADCGSKITAKVKAFSEKRFGRGLCMNCQQNEAVA